MAQRVEEGEVRAIIETDENVSLAPFIAAASAIVDDLSGEDSDGDLSSAMLTQIEKFLAAHLYEHLDSLPSEENTGAAKAVYQGQFGMGLKSTKYGQTALLMDKTGYLAALNSGKRRKLGVSWLGLPPSEQTEYEDRD